MVQQAVSVFPHITWSALNSTHTKLATRQSAPQLLIKALTFNFHCLLLNLVYNVRVSDLMFQVMSPNKLCNRFWQICFSSQCFVSMRSKSRWILLYVNSFTSFIFKHDAQTVCNCYLSAPSVKNTHVLLSFCSFLPPKTFTWSGWTGTTQSIAFIVPSEGLWGEEKKSGHKIFW